MGKAFEENEFTHNLGLDRLLQKTLHLTAFEDFLEDFY
jgi:hypothetical protein